MAPRRRPAEGELTFSKLLIRGVCKGKNLRGETDEAFVAKQTHLLKWLARLAVMCFETSTEIAGAVRDLKVRAF